MTRRGFVVPRVLIAAMAIAVLFGGGVAVGRWALGNDSTTGVADPTSLPASTPAPSSARRAATLLPSVVLQQADVKSGVNVQLLPGGNQVKGQATLDLCNGRFATEADRTARLQVVAIDGRGAALLSTEAVLYVSPAQSVEAFQQLQSVASSCPGSPVKSKGGGPSITTKFDAPPDKSWPKTKSVTRLAFSFTATYKSGVKQRSMAVYLRRGRALMGVYFSKPDAIQPKVDGQTAIDRIVEVFAKRLAKLPASVVDA